MHLHSASFSAGSTTTTTVSTKKKQSPHVSSPLGEVKLVFLMPSPARAASQQWCSAAAGYYPATCGGLGRQDTMANRSPACFGSLNLTASRRRRTGSRGRLLFAAVTSATTSFRSLLTGVSASAGTAARGGSSAAAGTCGPGCGMRMWIPCGALACGCGGCL